MKWIVCIKQVPNTSDIKLDRQTNNLLREGVPSIMNPYDLHALETAFDLQEKFGGRVVAISMGPPSAEECLRDALAMGADEAILLSDPAFRGSDTLATSYTLAAAIRQLQPFALVICGKQAVDGDTAQVGPELAEWLGIPQLTGVDRVIIEGNDIRAWREQEGGHLEVHASLPALVTVTKNINEPRLPTIKGRMAANRAHVTVWTKNDIMVYRERVGLAGSPTQVRRIFYPDHSRRGQIRQGGPQDLSDWLFSILTEQGVS
ncbi:electron transfer flavoprotein subunit beta/FixA family protein [Syntrophothermus lipocalidus]|uniref:Electron transfer flavoprotein small subunit n=1 Tax=Syntrophothermus lipocalidus (strain DSM 12680 / TGB-C1) TaxID=643648 RepID=D7CIX7_SYNLT|nr:electron transfer flavoprotein subunit beta/FixA family protein [Syntrophothermus lipocalidus]ADI02855.1 Electron transfer flavoprotein alpha/beta-subunit [Syntrophothermus lipocalidus DSM 12680]